MSTKSEKYLQLFNYLLDFAKLREKVVRKVEDYEECIWFSDIPDEEGYMCITSEKIEDKERPDWIKIKKPKELKFPSVPYELRNWIDEESVLNLEKPPALFEVIEKDGNIIKISEKPKLVGLYRDYIENYWIPWSIEEPNYRKKADLYKKFFSIYEKSKKFGEEFELVVSLGLINFQLENSAYIKRHLLVANATLEFFADKGIFTVGIGADGAKLKVETEMLQDLNLVNINNIQKEFEKQIEDSELTESPFSSDLNKLLEGFINKLHPESSYYNSLKFSFETPKYPTVYYAPALILRKRSLKSLSTLYQAIIDLINENPNLDLSLINDLTETDHDIQASDNDETRKKDELYTDIYFPKAYNEEQIQIIDKLSTRNKILVQGPPGTGKSHTIANLIAHLLAHGKTILITAHTKRALTVLKNQLPDEIKPLCVNLLGNDSQSVNDLESSVVNIIKKFDYASDLESERNINKQSQSLINSKQLQGELEEKLLNIKEFDTRKHNINEFYNGSLLEISKKILEDTEKNNWFKDNINDFDGAIKLVSLLENVTNQHALYKDIEKEFDFVFYNEPVLPKQAIEMLKSSEIALNNYKNNNDRILKEEIYEAIKQLSTNNISFLENYVNKLLEILQNFDSCKLRWSNTAIDDCVNGYSNSWKDIYETTTRSLSKEFKDKIEFFEKSHKFQYPKSITKQQIYSDVTLFITQMESGKRIKKIKLFNNKEVKERWYLTKDILVNGSLCDTLEEYCLLKEYITIEIEIENLERIWAGKIETHENNYHKFIEIEKNRLELEKITNLSNHYIDLKSKMIEIIKDKSISINTDFLNKVLISITLQKLSEDYLIYKRRKDDFLNALKAFIKKYKSHSIYNQIYESIEKDDIALYDEHLVRLEKILIEFEKYEDYKDNKNLLQEFFPFFIQSLETGLLNININDVSLKQAIAWSHAKSVIDGYLDSDVYSNTLEDLSEIESDISQTTSELASERAWYFLLKNMSTQHRKHLVAWFQAIKKIGKGTGKNAWKYRKEAQKQMDQCRTAIPAWIMPLYRITETIKPVPGMFDYIIIDEASQAGPDALFLLFIAKKLIIVGDDKQTAPEYIGIQTDSVESLLQKHLRDFPFANFYGHQHSFYDLAKIFIESGGGKVTLREHFRCMPEIIEFSNRNFYEPFGNSLYPLKQYSEKRLEPIKTTYVSNGISEGTSAVVYNLIEAKQICDTIENCIKNEQYNGKTMGVISLRGSNQAQRIEKMLLDKLGPEELEKRKIICGTSASFQGDERDVIFLSMVIDGKRNFRALTADPDKRRFNVAASRAKEQIWLFHSVRIDELVNHEDLRYLMLDYYLNPKTYTFPIIKLPQRFDFDKEPPSPFGSWFEVEIYNELTKLGYTLVPQYPVSKYRIDLGLIFPNGSKIAIECDGDQYHGIEEYQNDIMRQKVLERCGWQFIRIRGCEYFSDKSNTIAKVVEVLKDLGYESSKQDDLTFHDDISITKEIKFEELNQSAKNISIPKPLVEEPSSSLDETSKTDSLSKLSLIDWFNNIDGEIWFNFSRIGKEKDLLSPLERNFAFNMGRYKKRNWNPTEKQLNFAKKIFDKMQKSIKKDQEQSNFDFLK